MTGSVDASKSAIKTYVPSYQKEKWVRHAEKLDMSQSEFIRTMVQAGRRGFTPTHEEGSSRNVTPGGNNLQTTVLKLLKQDAYTWDELLDEVNEGIEVQLDETLEQLQISGLIRHSGRHNQYSIVTGDPDDA